ncbi:MAG: phage holin family protein [Planctomycetota bacterium]|jgi:uncharacterized membrane protein YvlD (DUF360 family)
MILLIKWAVLTAVFLGAAALIPGVKLKSGAPAFVTTAVFAVLNLLVGGLMTWLLTGVLILPIILTLGLAYLLVPLLVNAALLKAVDGLAEEEFAITGLTPLLQMSAVVSIAGFALSFLG